MNSISDQETSDLFHKLAESIEAELDGFCESAGPFLDDAYFAAFPWCDMFRSHPMFRRPRWTLKDEKEENEEV